MSACCNPCIESVINGGGCSDNVSTCFDDCSSYIQDPTHNKQHGVNCLLNANKNSQAIVDSLKHSSNTTCTDSQHDFCDTLSGLASNAKVRSMPVGMFHGSVCCDKSFDRNLWAKNPDEAPHYCNPPPDSSSSIGDWLRTGPGVALIGTTSAFALLASAVKMQRYRSKTNTLTLKQSDLSDSDLGYVGDFQQPNRDLMNVTRAWQSVNVSSRRSCLLCRKYGIIDNDELRLFRSFVQDNCPNATVRTIVTAMDLYSDTPLRRQAISDVISDIAARPKAWFSPKAVAYETANAEVAELIYRDVQIARKAATDGLTSDEWNKFLDATDFWLNSVTLKDMQTRAAREQPDDAYVTSGAELGRNSDETLEEAVDRRMNDPNDPWRA